MLSLIGGRDVPSLSFWEFKVDPIIQCYVYTKTLALSYPALSSRFKTGRQNLSAATPWNYSDFTIMAIRSLSVIDSIPAVPTGFSLTASITQSSTIVTTSLTQLLPTIATVVSTGSSLIASFPQG